MLEDATGEVEMPTSVATSGEDRIGRAALLGELALAAVVLIPAAFLIEGLWGIPGALAWGLAATILWRGVSPGADARSSLTPWVHTIVAAVAGLLGVAAVNWGQLELGGSYCSRGFAAAIGGGLAAGLASAVLGAKMSGISSGLAAGIAAGIAGSWAHALSEAAAGRGIPQGLCDIMTTTIGVGVSGAFAGGMVTGLARVQARSLGRRLVRVAFAGAGAIQVGGLAWALFQGGKSATEVFVAMLAMVLLGLAGTIIAALTGGAAFLLGRRCRGPVV